MKWYYKLLLMLGILMVIASFAAAIAWPFLWKVFIKEVPPTDVTTFASLVTIVLALLALGVGTFGTLSYFILRELLRREFREDIERRFNLALAHSESSVVYGFWRMGDKERQDTELLDTAIKYQEGARRRIGAIKWEDLAAEERKVIYKATSNLAGYIVCKNRCLVIEGTSSNIDRARREGKEAYEKADEFGDKYDWKANYAAVLNAFGTESQKKKAKEIIQELRERHKKREITDREMDEYNELWSNTQDTNQNKPA